MSKYSYSLMLLALCAFSLTFAGCRSYPDKTSFLEGEWHNSEKDEMTFQPFADGPKEMSIDGHQMEMVSGKATMWGEGRCFFYYNEAKGTLHVRSLHSGDGTWHTTGYEIVSYGDDKMTLVSQGGSQIELQRK